MKDYKVLDLLGEIAAGNEVYRQSLAQAITEEIDRQVLDELREQLEIDHASVTQLAE